MAKAGRKKFEITETVIKKVETMASRGLLDKEIMLALGISHDTFYKKKSVHPEFSEAIARGRAKGHANIANKLYEAADSGNLSAMQYYLARRCGWAEAVDTTQNEVPQKIEVVMQGPDEDQAE